MGLLSPGKESSGAYFHRHSQRISELFRVINLDYVLHAGKTDNAKTAVCCVHLNSVPHWRSGPKVKTQAGTVVLYNR
jgi:hypothetical protein